LFIFLAVLSLFPSSEIQAATRIKDLPANYRHWIEAEVPYIISTEEKKEFLALTTDAERDSFIDTFWRVRNPNPSSDVNTYKQEHYRRLAYANENFGTRKYEDGWHSDRGRMYIVLGAPKQRAQYHDPANLRPMEIWFYQAETPALPPYFYLLFYKRSSSEDFVLYSPVNDGPARLCATGECRNDNVMALSIIRKFEGDEVAKTAITLLPNESVNFRDFSPSMESDSLLNKISNLPDDPITKQRIEANRLREKVTSSVFLGDNDATLSYAVFRDERARMTLSYLLNLKFTDPRLIGTRQDGGSYYDLTLRTDIATPEGKFVYSQEDRLTGKLSPTAVENAKKKRFGAEARLPLTPGNYNLTATLTNNVNKVAIRQTTAVVVPAQPSGGIAFSGLLAYTKPAGIPDSKNQLPFSGSHFRFTPLGAQNVYIRQSDRLPLVFQLWLDPKTEAQAPPEKIHLHYVFGAISASHDSPSQEDEEVDAANRDQAGNLLTGHTLDTSGLLPGAYKVVVSATRDGEHKTVYATLNLHVAPYDNFLETWTAFGPIDPAGDTIDDLKRGMSAEAQHNDDDAEGAYKRALAEGAPDARALESLARLYVRKGMTDNLAALNQLPMLSKIAVDPSTLLAMSAAANKAGNPKAAARMLESQIAIQPPNAELYNALAEACVASGNTNRANEARALAQKLTK
jgi:Putative Zn-dependent protease, contains TPR repeats